MLGWFQRLMPQTLLFFPLFERHAKTVTAGAEALRQMLDGGERASQHCRDIMRLEEEADGITREVLIGIRSTFITPFDRGDIKDLITSMDDATASTPRRPARRSRVIDTARPTTTGMVPAAQKFSRPMLHTLKANTGFQV